MQKQVIVAVFFVTFFVTFLNFVEKSLIMQ